MPESADIELKVVADFNSLQQQSEDAKRKLIELRRENDRLRQSLSADKRELDANEKSTRQLKDALALLGKNAGANANEIKKQTAALKELSAANDEIRWRMENTRLAITDSNKAISAQEKALSSVGGASSKFISGAGKVYGVLRKIANIVPGLGISTLILMIGGPLVRVFGQWLGLSGKLVERQKQIAEFTEKAIGNIAKEAGEVTALIAVAKDEVKSKEERFAAMKKLQEIAPQYFSDLNKEKVSVDELKGAYDGYIESLKQRIKLEVNRTALTENIKEQITLEGKIIKAQDKQAQNDIKIAALRERANKALERGAINTYQSLSSQIESLQQQGIGDKLKSDLKDLKKEADNLVGDISSGTIFSGIDHVYNKLSATLNKLNNQELVLKTNEAEKKLAAVKEAIDSLMSDFGVSKEDPRIQSLVKAAQIYEKLIPKRKKEIETIASVLKEMNKELSNATTLEKVFGDDRSTDKINALTKAITKLTTTFKVPVDDKMIQGFKKQIADLESSQKITVPIELGVDMNAASLKLSNNERVMNMFSEERKNLIAQIKRMNFDKLPVNIDLENMSTEGLRKYVAFLEGLQQKSIDAAATITQILSPAFDQMFDAIFDGENAFKALGKGIQGVVLELAKAIAKAIIFSTILSAIPGVGSFGGSASRALGFANGGLVRRKASGGYISGPGTGRSDSIPAYLSNGEYVISAQMVQRFGKNFFDAINFGKSIPTRLSNRFADGGMVGSKVITPFKTSGLRVTGEFKLKNTELVAAVKNGTSQLNRFN